MRPPRSHQLVLVALLALGMAGIAYRWSDGTDTGPSSRESSYRQPLDVTRGAAAKEFCAPELYFATCIEPDTEICEKVFMEQFDECVQENESEASKLSADSGGDFELGRIVGYCTVIRFKEHYAQRGRVRTDGRCGDPLGFFGLTSNAAGAEATSARFSPPSPTSSSGSPSDAGAPVGRLVDQPWLPYRPDDPVGPDILRPDAQEGLSGIRLSATWVSEYQELSHLLTWAPACRATEGWLLLQGELLHYRRARFPNQPASTVEAHFMATVTKMGFEVIPVHSFAGAAFLGPFQAFYDADEHEVHVIALHDPAHAPEKMANYLAALKHMKPLPQLVGLLGASPNEVQYAVENRGLELVIMNLPEELKSVAPAMPWFLHHGFAAEDEAWQSRDTWDYRIWPAFGRFTLHATRPYSGEGLSACPPSRR